MAFCLSSYNTTNITTKCWFKLFENKTMYRVVFDKSNARVFSSLDEVKKAKSTLDERSAITKWTIERY